MNGFAKGLGCFVAILIVSASSFPLLFGLAWSGAHCEPVPECQRSSEIYFAGLFAGLLVVAGLIGFAFNKIVARLARTRADDGVSASFIVSTSVIAVAVAAAAIWLVYAGFGFLGP